MTEKNDRYGCRVLIIKSRIGWRKRRDDQFMKCIRNKNGNYVKLGSISSPLFPIWGSRDDAAHWSDTLSAMT